MGSPDGSRVNGNGSSPPRASVRPRWLRQRITLLVALDGLAVATAALLARLWTFGLDPAGVPVRSFTVPYNALAVAAVPAWLAVLAVTGCYDVGPFGTTPGEPWRVVRAGADFLALVAVAYFVVHLENLARGVLVVMVPLAAVLTLVLRGLARWHLRTRRLRGHAVRRAVIVGSRPSVSEILQRLVEHPGSGLEPVAACVPDSTGPITVRGRRVAVLGGPDAVIEALRRSGADTLVFTGSLALDRVRTLAWTLEGSGIDVFVVPALSRRTAQLDVRPVAGLPLVYVDHSPGAAARQHADSAA